MGYQKFMIRIHLLLSRFQDFYIETDITISFVSLISLDSICIFENSNIHCLKIIMRENNKRAWHEFFRDSPVYKSLLVLLQPKLDTASSVYDIQVLYSNMLIKINFSLRHLSNLSSKLFLLIS